MKLLILILLITISGCAQLPDSKQADNQFSQWLAHLIDANAIQTWDLRGRLSVKTANDSGTATLIWKQQLGSYELRVIAPFGQGTYTLKAYPDGLIMQGPDAQILTADTPEALMENGFGWSVHLNGLKYWIRGIPEPGVSYSKLELDGNGRLQTMTQSGFDISIQRYADNSLPEKLSIKSDNIQLKLVIKQWET